MKTTKGNNIIEYIVDKFQETFEKIFGGKYEYFQGYFYAVEKERGKLHYHLAIYFSKNFIFDEHVERV